MLVATEGGIRAAIGERRGYELFRQYAISPFSLHPCRHIASRSDRYNHEIESGEEDPSGGGPMFWSFSTASPRHSIVALEPNQHPLAMLAASSNEWAARMQAEEAGENPGQEIGDAATAESSHIVESSRLPVDPMPSVRHAHP
jgi:hypothetical protein